MRASLHGPLWPMVAAGLLGLSLGLLSLSFWLFRRPGRLLRRRMRQGFVGERQAAGLLERAGYRIIASQHAGSFEALLDGERRSFPLRADFLVQRRADGRLLLAEVKTGAVAPRLDHGPTRRQLLEYALAYREEIAGVLLVAPERGEISCVSFPVLAPRRPVVPFLAGVLVGATLLWLLYWV